MALFVWNDKFSVNVKELDDHHKKLIDLVNELHNGMKLGKSKEIMSTILKKLIEYTAFHFAAEEKLFEKYAYPQRNIHKAEHDKLVAKVLKFQKDFEKGSVMASIEVFEFLKDWLINHIQQSDKQYAPFLNEKGVS